MKSIVPASRIDSNVKFLSCERWKFGTKRRKIIWIQILIFQMTKSQHYNGVSKLILCSSVALMSTTNPQSMSFRAQSGAEIYFWEWKKANLGQIHPFVNLVHQKKLQIYCFKKVLFCSKNKFKISHVMKHNAVRLDRIIFFQWSFWKKIRFGHVLGVDCGS